ncbi:lysophospholipid acyltransferase family protein [Desulfuromonas acetoxidans]|uniref:Phospholipid/glycerol acyltransferase n=1 Tax=Desulfuromonas acetoxidans (strain DSM 684 / 11070) TaxID=281689 RepID=Q1JZZ9_DESA6|nr:GNAT family N-acyltransferase [Desulfuromonas acetoxidans]EAT15743.1 phospholipid/glycerol acyltransferase [Desulfuromonas acetoxidans DSM 684]MBF0646023.1 lysophospholipid acyltransferase family protein [Desulfuromonas acetoxidans]NVD25866.1 lysophospholipid acyltransferase family protein [Desulfuromonas acetoxidans]NVE16898.1 lysophospholipid acyltransferase family protein [Desulfuromonas acetoxidans]
MIGTDNTLASPFLLSRQPVSSVPARLKKPLLMMAEHLLGLQRCQRLYDRVSAQDTEISFAEQALNTLDVRYQLSDHEQARIPTSGPCILIANHPFGGIEGLILMALLGKVRPDFKVMANFMLSGIPQLRDQLINVDPFGGADAARTNLTPLRQSLNWLKQGGMLVIFPAGEVSSRQATGEITDPVWSSTLPRLVRRSKAPVLPVFFPGENGALFQWAGRLHPRLRTLLLPHMLLNKAGQTLPLRIGNLLPSKKLIGFATSQELNNYLRLRTYGLNLATNTRAKTVAKSENDEPQPISAPRPAETLKNEIAALPEAQHLVHSGDFAVVEFTAAQAPGLLNEIGRLREVTFRDVGEGTGHSIDLDRFDETYTHLCLWNHKQGELVGAYRIGRVDDLLGHYGAEGLYTSTLFNFQPQLLERLHNALELGRSFIRPEYQRSYAPLLLLWKGIGHYLVNNPHYRYLFGPVSISNDYTANSRHLMVDTLTRYFMVKEWSGLVSPRLPVPVTPLKIQGLSAQQSDPLLRDMDEISALIADLESDSRGIPVLLRHYLSLGGKLLAFNLDPDFGHVIDGLLLVDLQQTERKQLQRYMGRQGYANYLAVQQHQTAACA